MSLALSQTSPAALSRYVVVTDADSPSSKACSRDQIFLVPSIITWTPKWALRADVAIER